jgi:hypothetical protein
MTVAAATPLTNIVSILNQTDFPFTWRADSAADVKVYIDDVLQGGPVVNLNADQVAAPGGTVVLAMQPAGKTISIERTSGSAQASAVAAYGPFQGSLVERTMDRMVMIAQELLASFTRSFKVSRAGLPKISSFEFPAPVLGYVPAWADAGGGLFKLSNVPQGAVGPQGPAGGAAPALDAVTGTSPFVANNDNAWRDVGGLSIVTPNFAAPALADISWVFSGPFCSAANATVVRLMIDGAEIPGTRQAQQSIQANFSGRYAAVLGAGIHTIKLQYRTLAAWTVDLTTDWQSSRIQCVRWN